LFFSVLSLVLHLAEKPYVPQDKYQETECRFAKDDYM
jgi:hypothetical protein